MKRYIQGEDRTQATLLPELLDDYVADTNPNGAVRRVSRRVCRYSYADMALLWTAAGFLEAEK